MQPDPPPGTTTAMQMDEGGAVQQPSTQISGQGGRGASGGAGCSDLAAAAGAMDVDWHGGRGALGECGCSDLAADAGAMDVDSPSTTQMYGRRSMVSAQISGRRSTVGGPAAAAAASATILQQQHAKEPKPVIERVEKFLKENDLDKMPSKKSCRRNASGRLRMLHLGTEFYRKFKGDPNASLPDGWLELEKETCPYEKATAEYLKMKVSYEKEMKGKETKRKRSVAQKNLKQSVAEKKRKQAFDKARGPRVTTTTEEEAAKQALLDVHMSSCAAHVHHSRQLRYLCAGDNKKTYKDSDSYDEFKKKKLEIRKKIEEDVRKLVHVDQDDWYHMVEGFKKASTAKMNVCAFCGTRDLAKTYITYNLRDLDEEHWAVVDPKVLQKISVALDEEIELLSEKRTKFVRIKRRQLLHLYIDVGDPRFMDPKKRRGYHVVEAATIKKMIKKGEGEEERVECKMCSECDKGKTGPIGMFVAPTMGNVRPEFITAETCIQEHLYTDKAPTFSIAAGYDFGCLSELKRLGVPMPTMKDMLVISKVRCFFITVKVVANSKVTDRSRLAGHFIAFPHGPVMAANAASSDGVAGVGGGGAGAAHGAAGGAAGAGDDRDCSRAFPAAAIQAAAAQLPILFVGPKGSGSHLHAAAMQIEDIKCTVPGLYNGFQLARLLRGATEDALPHMTQGEQKACTETLERLHSEHVASAQHKDDVTSMAVETLSAGSDIANVGANARSASRADTANDLAAAAAPAGEGLAPRMHSVGVFEAVQLGMADIVGGVARACRRETPGEDRQDPPATLAAAAHASDPQAPAAASSAADGTVRIESGEDPLDDYGGHADILYEAFWPLFPLRRGLVGGKPPNKKLSRRLMTYYDARCVPKHPG